MKWMPAAAATSMALSGAAFAVGAAVMASGNDLGFILALLAFGFFVSSFGAFIVVRHR